MGIFNFLVRMGLDASSFEAGAKRTESVMAGLENTAKRRLGVAIAGAFSAAAVSSLMHKTIEYADRIGDLADKLSLTTEEVQKLDVLANRTGTDVEQMGNVFLKIGEFRKRVIDGDKEAISLVNSMGISLEQMRQYGNNNLAVSLAISDAYEKTNKSAKEQSDLVAIGGVKAEKILSILSQLHSLGPIKLISEEDIKAISEFKDAIEESKRGTMIAAAPVVAFMSRVMQRANRYESENPDVGERFDSSVQNPFRLGGSIPIGDAIKVEWLKKYLPDNIPLPELPERIPTMLPNPLPWGPKKFHVPFMGSRFTPHILEAFFDELGADRIPKPGEEKFIGPTMPKGGFSDPVKEMEKEVASSSLSGGKLRSIGGFFFDRFDEQQPVRQIVRWTEKTANAAEETKKILQRVEGNQ